MESPDGNAYKLVGCETSSGVGACVGLPDRLESRLWPGPVHQFRRFLADPGSVLGSWYQRVFFGADFNFVHPGTVVSFYAALPLGIPGSAVPLFCGLVQSMYISAAPRPGAPPGLR